MTIADFINECSLRALAKQNRNGSWDAGHNGPYHDMETPVRNTAHWLMACSKSYRLTARSEYLDAVASASRFLLRKELRPKGQAFYLRESQTKDRCNGLIGQAWVMEALIQASKILGDSKYQEVAKDVFFLHEFSQENKLWRRRDIGGECLDIDPTFNHQLWFAAVASALMKKNGVIFQRVQDFMNNLQRQMSVSQSGLILHLIKTISPAQFELSLIDIFNKLLGKFSFNKRVANRKSIDEKALGYHSFNMYGFAMLKINFPNHSFWESKKMQMACQFMMGEDYKRLLETNPYGYPYNPPGFEVPFALSVFASFEESKMIDISRQWIHRQLQRSFNRETFGMDYNTEDALVLTSRIYELTRWPNHLLNQVVLDKEIF